MWDIVAAVAVWFGSDPWLPECCAAPYVAALERIAEREQVANGRGVCARSLRERLDTARDWPRLEELARFARQHRDCRAAWLSTRVALDVIESHRGIGTLRPWELDDWRDDLHHRSNCWGHLDDATNLACRQFVRRRHLAELRTLLGPSAWTQAAMPDPIPVNFYRRIP